MSRSVSPGLGLLRLRASKIENPWQEYSCLIFAGNGDDSVHAGRASARCSSARETTFFVWNPGEGSDTGYGHADAMQSNGANADERMSLSAAACS